MLPGGLTQCQCYLRPPRTDTEYPTCGLTLHMLLKRNLTTLRTVPRPHLLLVFTGLTNPRARLVARYTLLGSRKTFANTLRTAVRTRGAPRFASPSCATGVRHLRFPAEPSRPAGSPFDDSRYIVSIILRNLQH